MDSPGTSSLFIGTILSILASYCQKEHSVCIYLDINYASNFTYSHIFIST
jgi:hypothetical protein